MAGLLCVELRRRDQQVVAIDADTVPGLADVLGMERSDQWDLAGMAERNNGGWRLAGTPADVIDRCAREAPAGVRFVQSGNVDSSLKDFELRRESHMDRWSGTMAFNTVSRQFDDPDGWAIVDLQGGTLQVAGGLAGTSGIALMVVEPFAKSLLTARRFAEMRPWPAGLRLAAVVNKVGSSEDDAYVRDELARLQVPVWVTVPRDPAVQQAEREAIPLVSLPDGSPVKRAVAHLADRLQEAAEPAGAASGATTR